MDGHAQYREWKNWDQEAFGRHGRSEAAYFHAEMVRAGLLGRGSLRILEIGFGNGGFAGWSRAQGWHYTGTERDPSLVTRARAAGFDAYEASLPLGSLAETASLDLVIAFDVLEHLDFSETTGLLRAARPLLKPSGIVLARFPSGDSPFAGAIQRGDLTHRSVIGSGIIEQLARSAGFDVVMIGAPLLPLQGVGLLSALRRAAIRLARAIIGFILRRVYYDNQPRVLEPNMVVILRARSEA